MKIYLTGQPLISATKYERPVLSHRLGLITYLIIKLCADSWAGVNV